MLKVDSSRGHKFNTQSAAGNNTGAKWLLCDGETVFFRHDFRRENTLRGCDLIRSLANRDRHMVLDRKDC